MNLLCALLIVCVILLSLCVGGMIAEYILPKSRRLTIWIENLPIVRDERREDHAE